MGTFIGITTIAAILGVIAALTTKAGLNIYLFPGIKFGSDLNKSVIEYYSSEDSKKEIKKANSIQVNFYILCVGIALLWIQKD